MGWVPRNLPEDLYVRSCSEKIFVFQCEQLKNMQVSDRKKKIAYILSIFPAYTETFISNEILEVQKKMDVYIFSLKNFSQKLIHKDCIELKKKTFYSPYLLSFNLAKAQLYFFSHELHKYLYCLFEVIFKHIMNPIMLLKMLFIFPKIIYFTQIMKSLKIQHIHTHWANISSTAAYIAANLLSISYSFTTHAFDIFVAPSMLRTKLRSAKYIVTISEYNKKWLLDEYGEEYKDKIYVIHCGIDTMKFYLHQYQQDKLFNIFSVGRFIKKKGLEHLIGACRVLNDKGMSFRCFIVGEGPEKRKLQRLIQEYRLFERVKLISPLTQEEILVQLSKSHTFILPCVLGNKNDMDGIPVSLMEAMAMRLPVISTKISGIPELIEDNISGLLVSPGDEQEIADAIIRLMRDSKLREKLGLNARDKVVRDFNIITTANQLVSLLKREVM